MKKYIALLLVLVMALSFAACGAEKPTTSTPDATPGTQVDTPSDTPTDAPVQDTVKVMTHAEYIAAPMDSQVVVECYVQGHQSWWDNKITVYAQDEDGAYFLYEMACSEEDAAKLTTGTAIRVTGYKGEWAGEVEIMDATFEFIDGNFVAAPVDATAWLGTDELIAHQNELVSFTGMTVEAVEYKNGEPGDDIYVTLGYGGASYSFCVEVYLTGPDTDVYTTVGSLAVGDTVDLQGFLYWYEGPNTHITSITKTASAPVVMSYAEYDAAGLDEKVVVECYVQAHQSWWDNKITVYAQDEDGAYFLYEMACSEEDAAKLTPGTAIRVTGYKGEWAGEVEIMDATFEFIEGSYIATPVDATAWLGTDELIEHQNELVSFTGMTVEGIEYKNGEPGDDIYVTLGCGGASYSFCVEVYLTGPDTDVYTTVGSLAVGDVVDVQGFLYWYEGPNTHITSITKTASAPAAPAQSEQNSVTVPDTVKITFEGTVTENAAITVSYGGAAYETTGTRIDLKPGSSISFEAVGEGAFFFLAPYRWDSGLGGYTDAVEGLALPSLQNGPVDAQFGTISYDGDNYQVDAYINEALGYFFFLG